MASVYDIKKWYWSVTDSSPGTQVFSTFDDDFVPLADAGYVAWLAADGGNTPTTIATAADLWAIFDLYAQSSWAGRAQSISSTVTVNLTQPLASDLTITPTGAGGIDVVLPNFRSPRGPGIGKTFTIRNGAVYPPTGTHPGKYIRLLANDGSTVLGFILGNMELKFQLQANTTKNGTLIVPPSPARIAGYTRGLFLWRSAGQELTINFDEVVLRDGSGDQLFVIGSPGTFASLAFQGAGGRDQAGAFAAGDIIHVYLIAGRATAIKGLTSLNASTPTLPTGYTHWVKVGTYKLDGAVLYPNIWQEGDTTWFVSAPLVLNGGTNVAAYGGLGGAGEVLLNGAGILPSADCVKSIILDVESFQMVASAGGVIDALLQFSHDGANTFTQRRMFANLIGAGATFLQSSGQLWMPMYLLAGNSRFWYRVAITTGSTPAVNVRLLGYKQQSVVDG